MKFMSQKVLKTVHRLPAVEKGPLKAPGTMLGLRDRSHHDQAAAMSRPWALTLWLAPAFVAWNSFPRAPHVAMRAKVSKVQVSVYSDLA